MTEPHDPFEILRATARVAVIPTAADVRRRGHARLVRVRVIGAVGAVLVVTAGTGVAVALQGNGSGPAIPGVAPTTTRLVTPRLQVPPSTPPTTRPAAATEPTAPPTTRLAPPPRTSAPPAPSTTLAPPPVVPIPPSMVAPPTTTTGRPSGLYLHLTLHRTSPDGDPTVKFTVTVEGVVQQMYGYDGTWGPAITEQGSPNDVRVLLDGKAVGGSDGGAIGCRTGDTRVHHEHSTWQEGAIVPKGTHTVMFLIEFCNQVGKRSFTVTVP